MKSEEKQVGGDHYKKFGKMQPMMIADVYDLNRRETPALKYLLRTKGEGIKDRIIDLGKAIHYLEWEIERLEALEAEKDDYITDLQVPALKGLKYGQTVTVEMANGAHVYGKIRCPAGAAMYMVDLPFNDTCVQVKEKHINVPLINYCKDEEVRIRFKGSWHYANVVNVLPSQNRVVCQRKGSLKKETFTTVDVCPVEEKIEPGTPSHYHQELPVGAGKTEFQQGDYVGWNGRTQNSDEYIILEVDHTNKEYKIQLVDNSVSSIFWVHGDTLYKL